VVTAWGGKPIFTTETGYFNDVSKADGVPEDVAGKYLQRLLFLQWMHGIRRTYVCRIIADPASIVCGDGAPLPGNPVEPDLQLI